MRSVARSSISATSPKSGTLEHPMPWSIQRTTYPRIDCTLASTSACLSAALQPSGSPSGGRSMSSSEAGVLIASCC